MASVEKCEGSSSVIGNVKGDDESQATVKSKPRLALRVCLSDLAATDHSPAPCPLSPLIKGRAKQDSRRFDSYQRRSMYARLHCASTRMVQSSPDRAAEYRATALGAPLMQQWFAEAAGEIAAP